MKNILRLTNKPLHLQPLFWFSLSLPIVTSIILLFPLMGEYSWSFSVDGLNFFYERSKFQFSIMLLSVPIGVLIARLHSTVQKEADLGNARTNLENQEDDRLLELINIRVKYIKDELTKESGSHIEGIAWKPISNGVSWSRAAKDLISIFQLRRNIKSSVNLMLCDESLERLNLHLYRELNNSGEPLPPIFFTCVPGWEEKYLIIKSVENFLEQEDKYNELSSTLADGSYYSTAYNVSPSIEQPGIGKEAIVCIFDFVNLFTEYNPDKIYENRITTVENEFDENIVFSPELYLSKEEYVKKISNVISLSEYPIWNIREGGWHCRSLSEGAYKYLLIEKRRVDRLEKEIKQFFAR